MSAVPEHNLEKAHSGNLVHPYTLSNSQLHVGLILRDAGKHLHE